ncbi:MAG: YidC/Oxa1 family insertase periplasmic-domain containing protein, partial [Planctomycetes bacterium]|nr:YidC/Oxa1 family insertase periplasmic-domain containing protein [Planctomycetota bacterium]
MQKGVLFRALMWSMAVFFAWQIIAVRIWPPPPPDPQADTAQPADQTPFGPTEAPASADSGASTGPSPATPAASAATGRLTARGADGLEHFTLGTVDGAEECPNRMRIELTNRGAAIESVILSDFAETVDGLERYRLVEPLPAPGGLEFTSMPVELIRVDQKHDVPLADLYWHGATGTSSQPPGETVTFTAEVADDQGRALLRLTRRYFLPRQAFDEKRYDLSVDLSVENLSDRPLEVAVNLLGPIGFQKIETRMGDDRAISIGRLTEDQVELNSLLFSKAAGGESHPLHTLNDRDPFWWAAVDNKFFTWIVTPLTPEGREGPGYISEVEAVDRDGLSDTDDDVTLRLAISDQTIAPGVTVSFPMECYLGPKDRTIFGDAEGHPDYARRNFFLLISRMYTWCAFSWLAELMIWLLAAMHLVIRNYGVAVIILVLVVRTLLHPITKKGQVNMMKMQKEMGKLQPKMAELKKKHANDKARLNTEMQKLYQNEGINPAGQMLTCLPMMLQMPIWIALYTSLNNNIAMRHQGFLWAKDLTAPDALIQFGTEFNIPLIGSMMGPISSFNILPILWAFSMYAQQKLMPKPTPPPGGEPSAGADQAAQMQKMMPFMSIIFALMFYNAPSGLTLYIMASTVFGTIEQYRIRQHIKDLEKHDPTDGIKRAGPQG